MKKLVLKLIRFYKKHLSYNNYWLNAFYLSEGNCRFTPTCSDYAYQAIDKYGFIKGFFLGIWRILKCHPFSRGGFDPLR